MKDARSSKVFGGKDKARATSSPHDTLGKSWVNKFISLIAWSPLWAPAVLLSLIICTCLGSILWAAWVGYPSQTEKRLTAPQTIRELRTQVELSGTWHDFDDRFELDPGVAKGDVDCQPGIYRFVSVIPPGTIQGEWTIVVEPDGPGDANLWLVDGKEKDVPPVDYLERVAATTADLRSPGGASGPFLMDRERWDEFLWDDNPTIGTRRMYVMYLTSDRQCSADVSYYSTHPYVHEWIVEVGSRDAASITVPAGGWNYLWIVPLRDPAYWSDFAGLWSPPDGIGRDQLEQVLPQADVDLLIDGSLGGAPIKYHGLYVQIDQHAHDGGPAAPKPLVDPIVLSDSDCKHEKLTVHFGLNVVPGYTAETPARVLVGISQ